MVTYKPQTSVTYLKLHLRSKLCQSRRLRRHRHSREDKQWLRSRGTRYPSFLSGQLACERVQTTTQQNHSIEITETFKPSPAKASTRRPRIKWAKLSAWTFVWRQRTSSIRLVLRRTSPRWKRDKYRIWNSCVTCSRIRWTRRLLRRRELAWLEETTWLQSI